ncbi:MAG: LacI family DNA-binding transcriptional regulator [Phycisphaeraceae bacterium JB051]
MARKQHATMADVARKAGVGVTTVSYVLRNINSGWSISDETRQRVHDAAKEVNYQPNAAARALATNKTGYIGFLLSDEVGGGLSNVYFAQQLAGVEEIARQRGYCLSVNRYNFTHIDKLVLPDQVGKRSVDGLILTGHVCKAAVVRITEFGIPVVSIGDAFEYEGLVPSITHDFAQGLYDAVRHLAELGHRKISWTRLSNDTGSDRIWSLLQSKVQQDDTLNHIQLHDRLVPLANEENGVRVFADWHRQPVEQRESAMILGGCMIQPFLQQMRRHQLQCPRDLSLISGIDQPGFVYNDPPITAIDHHCQTLGELAANALIDHLDKKTKLKPVVSPAPTTLVVRESCGHVVQHV